MLAVSKYGVVKAFSYRLSAVEKRIACHACDLLVDITDDSGVIACPRCDSVLCRLYADSMETSLAFAVAAAVLLALACSFPFVSFTARGIESEVTLLQTPWVLWQYGRPFVALLVGSFIVAIPAVILFLIIEITHAIITGYFYVGLRTSAWILFSLFQWAMAEVFIIGVMVSMVKIVNMADVSLGISFWSYVGFGLCFTAALSSLDRYQVWNRLDGLVDAPPEAAQPEK